MPEMTPPSHLSDSTRTWWKTLVEAYEFESHHLRLLQGACEAWDRAQHARRVLKREGVYVRDRFGQIRAHPAVDVERKSRDQFRVLLRELSIDTDAPNEQRAPGLGANAHLRIAR